MTTPAGSQMISCAVCGADVLRPDYADCVFWPDPDGVYVVAHTRCLEPYDEALRAVLEHS